MKDFEIAVPLTIPATEDLDDPEVIKELEEASKPPAKKKIKPPPGSRATPKNRILVDTIRTCLAEGKSDTRIAEELSLDTATYIRLKRQLYQWEMETLQAKTPEEHYIDYRLKQEQTIKDLETMSTEFRNSNNHNALVGAIRLKSEILGKIWQTGRDMGIIKATPDRDKEIAGALISQLDKKAIREKVISEVKSLYKIVAKFGDRDILDEPETAGASKELDKPKIKREKH